MFIRSQNRKLLTDCKRFYYMDNNIYGENIEFDQIGHYQTTDQILYVLDQIQKSIEKGLLVYDMPSIKQIKEKIKEED